MNSKGNYYAENLACQNLGDCSLCNLPVLQEENIQENLTEPKNEKSRKTISLKALLKKFNPENAA